MLALAIALASHAALVALLMVSGAFEVGKELQAGLGLMAGLPPNAADDRPLEIETIVNQLNRPDEKTPEEKRREELAKKEEEDRNPHGQVVDIAKPVIEERPDTAKYAAEYDSKVDRETKAQSRRDRGGAPTEAAPASRPEPPLAPQASSRERRPGAPGALALRELERRTVVRPGRPGGGLTPEPGAGGELERGGEHGEGPLTPPRAGKQGGEGGAPGGVTPERRPSLLATPEMLRRAIGRGSGSMDYLKDVDDGESTALNAKKWKHAPFFNRVKRAVADEWHPEVVYVRHDPSGNVYGVKDRVTVLRIHLDPHGKLAAWTVLQSSGVDFLDDEAIDSFRKAQPFPNPPKDLVESDGQIHFNFAFIFELSGRTSFKVFKYQ